MRVRRRENSNDDHDDDDEDEGDAAGIVLPLLQVKCDGWYVVSCE